jgi:transcriptional regulator GlxA family with amidase domain
MSTRRAPAVTSSRSARKTSGKPRHIVVVAFDGISPFHLSVPCLVFGEDRSDIGVAPFDFAVCAVESGPLSTSAGFRIDTKHGLGALRNADVVVIPSWRDVDERPPEALLRALVAAHRRGATVVGLCLGAFVLAQAGLLDGRKATTHWHWASLFASRYPLVRLDPSVLYVDEDRVVTSAGTAASIDCCLHLLRTWCGATLANRVARRLVVAPHRTGGQSQFIEEAIPQTGRGGRMHELLEWLQTRLNQAHDIDTLAARLAMSRRTFTRHFQRTTGTTLVQWLTWQRLARASQLLESSDRSVEAIALDSGFGSPVSLRQHFVARYGVSPTAYRRQFQAVADA